MKESEIQSPPYPTWIFLAVSTLIVLSGMVWIILTKSDTDNAVLFGLSLFRLFLVFVIFLPAVGLGWLSARVKTGGGLPGWLSRGLALAAKPQVWLSFGYFSLGWLLYPASQMPVLPSLFDRLKPIVWIIFGITVNLMVRFWMDGEKAATIAVRSYLAKNSRLWKTAAVILAIFMVGWILVAVTKTGIKPDLYWKVAGVPLLPFQLYLILGGMLLLAVLKGFLANRGKQLLPRAVDWMAFVLIWALAAGIWLSIPQERSVFAPGPYPPADILYPHSDGAVHDSGGEFITIGQPLNNGEFTDKPAYMFLLGLFHLLFGDNIQTIVTVQVILLALLPSVLYLLGKEIHSRNLGIFIALVEIARAGNAISAVTQITTTSVKEFMSEMPLALALAVLSLLLLRYYRNRDGYVLPICLGGVYGISILIRPHPLLFAPVLALAVIIVQWKSWRKLIVHGLLVILGAGLVFTPISISNVQHGRRPDIMEKILMVLDRAKYTTPEVDESADLLPLVMPTAQPAVVSDESSPTDVPQMQASITVTPAPQEVIMAEPPSINNKFVRLAGHMIHHEITILLSFPNSLVFNDLNHTLSASYWNESTYWDGQLTPGQFVGLFGVLIFFALGLAHFCSRSGWEGLLPILLQITINLANALARSSGGRFLVPADWIIYLYVAIGLFTLGGLLVKWIPISTSETITPSQVIVRESRPAPYYTATGFLIFGLALAGIQVLVPPKYPQQMDAAAVLKEHQASDLVASSDPDQQTLLSGEEGLPIYGKALYPRFYSAGEGEPSPNSPLAALPYSRLTFQVVSPAGNYFITLPSTVRGKKLQNGSSVLVLGCRQYNNRVLAVDLVIFGADGNTLYRSNTGLPESCGK
jgi:4-amino-4-deoxy-L-arabinose transferase-like glycosyltransferase